jgi:hypothetical protein
MEGEVAGAVITGIVLVSVIVLIKLLSDNKNVKFLYTDRFEYRVPSALKWGIVLIGIGLAFLIGQLVPSDVSGEVTIGSMFILAGLALLVYYVIAKSMVNRSDK